MKHTYNLLLLFFLLPTFQHLSSSLKYTYSSLFSSSSSSSGHHLSWHNWNTRVSSFSSYLQPWVRRDSFIYLSVSKESLYIPLSYPLFEPLHPPPPRPTPFTPSAVCSSSLIFHALPYMFPFSLLSLFVLSPLSHSLPSFPPIYQYA